VWNVGVRARYFNMAEVNMSEEAQKMDLDHLINTPFKKLGLREKYALINMCYNRANHWVGFIKNLAYLFFTVLAIEYKTGIVIVGSIFSAIFVFVMFLSMYVVIGYIEFRKIKTPQIEQMVGIRYNPITQRILHDLKEIKEKLEK
jgi:hypothetical protein